MVVDVLSFIKCPSKITIKDLESSLEGVVYCINKDESLVTILVMEENDSVGCMTIAKNSIVNIEKCTQDHPIVEWWNQICIASEHNTAEEIPNNRRELVCSWLNACRIRNHTDEKTGDIIIFDGLARIESPYNSNNCHSVHENVVNKLRKFVFDQGPSLHTKSPVLAVKSTATQATRNVKSKKKANKPTEPLHHRYGEILLENTLYDPTGAHEVKVTSVNLQRYSLGAPSSRPYSQNDDTLSAFIDPKLRKYYAQRYRLFHKYDQGIQLDDVSWYSVTPERIAEHIAERCRCDVILDIFAGAGGNAIQFAFTCERVIAIDNDAERLELCRQNARVYGVEDRIDFILGDAVSILKAIPTSTSTIDVVFLAPPWGGVGYKDDGAFRIERGIQLTSPGRNSTTDGIALLRLAKKVCDHVVYCLPRTTDPATLLEETQESFEFERHLVDGQIKMCAAYYGEF